MNVLVVGAGIAGTTLAYWLRRTGHEVTLVERAPELRRGGYVIDFWGAGFDVAERMGIVPALMEKGAPLTELRQVDARGRRIASLNPELFVRSTGGRYVSIARGDLAEVIYAALEGKVETVFGDTVRSLEDDGRRVRVTFETHRTRDFDLVVGADGLHSRIRRLVFGPDDHFEKDLGIDVAAFDIEGYRPRDERIAVMHTEVGLSVTRLALRDDVTTFLVTRLAGGGWNNEREARAGLRHRMASTGWEAPLILERMEDARTFYFDRVSQIRMPSWTRGRVALLGDACACVSLLAGQGSALAMVGAYVLASQLAASGGDHTAAFPRYEADLAPLLLAKQKAAVGFASAFAPKNGLSLFARNTVMKLMGIPLVAELAMGKSLRDSIDLPPPPA